VATKFLHFSTKVMYTFVLWLSELFPALDLPTCCTLVESLVAFHHAILQAEKFVEEERPAEEEKVLRTWKFNSKLHNNQSDIHIAYSYPMATRFVIEFDPTCHLSSSAIDQESTL
jgi:hypothetical protein